MSRSSSPFFRHYDQKTEVSPLLAGDTIRQTKFDARLNGGSARKPKPSRTSMPLVYTDFRSPEVARPNPIDTKAIGGKDNDRDDSGGGSLRSPFPGQQLHHLKDAISRHSFVTNLERIGSKTVWMILLTPIILGVLASFMTIPWRYRSWTTEFTGNAITFTAPRALHQAGFIRSFISIPGYTCNVEQCDNEILDMQAHRVSEDFDSPHALRLLHTHLNLTQYVADYYAPLHNASINTNKTILVPLPMLRLDKPVFGLNPNGDKIRITASLSDTIPSDPGGTDPTSSSKGVADTASSENRTTENPAVMYHEHTRRARALRTTSPPTLEVITSTRTYILAVALLQILMSLLTFLYLLRIVGHVYVNAVQLRDKFATAHTPRSPAHQTYGSLHSTYDTSADELLTLDSDRVESTLWHFILPEQYSAVSMLFFLFLWQGLLPAMCVVWYDIGLHVSEGFLFSAGVVTSVAQYGLIFALIVYIDGLKYHSNSPYKPRHLGTSSAATQAYDPFETAQTSTAAYTDTLSTEYWRRSTARMCTFDNTTPLQREYKSAIALYITFHHPCSIEFVGFVHKKLILLLLTWVVVVVYWLLYYPRVWHRAALAQEQFDDVSFRHAVVKWVLLALSAVWGFWAIQVSISTGLRLRRLKLNASRFRQVAYRTLLFQMQLGLLVLLGICLYYSYTHDFFVHTSFTSSASALRYLYAWCMYYGLLHVNTAHTPPLAVHGVEALLFVSALVYSIAFCMQPPQEDPGSSKFNVQAFVALERSLPEYTSVAHYYNTTSNSGTTPTHSLRTPTHHAAHPAESIQHSQKALSTLRQHLVDEEYKKFMNIYLKRILQNHDNKRYFCIESALILLEISYQTYFSTDTVQSTRNNADKSKVATKSGHVVTFSSSNGGAANVADTAAADTNPFSTSDGDRPGAARVMHTTTSDSSIFSISNSNSSVSGGYSTANSPLHSSCNPSPRYAHTNSNVTSSKYNSSNTSSAKSTNPFDFGEEDTNAFSSSEGTSPTNPFETDEPEQTMAADANLSESEAQVSTTATFEITASSGSADPPDSPVFSAEASSPSDALRNPFYLSDAGLPAEAGERVETINAPTCTNPFDSPTDETCVNAGVVNKSVGEVAVPWWAAEEPLAAPSNPFEDSCAESDTSAVNTNPSVAAAQPQLERSLPEPLLPVAASELPEALVPQYGPKLNLAGLGYTLRDTFKCDACTTFGFLATECSTATSSSVHDVLNTTANAATTNTISPVHCEYVSNRVVVSFRGSLLGNAVTNLKIAQVTLPSLKRPRSFFTKLIREFSSGAGDGSSGNVYSAYDSAYPSASTKRRSDTLTSDDCDLIRDADLTPGRLGSVSQDLNASADYSQSDLHDDYQTLLHRMESGENEEENENFIPPESSASAAEQLKNTQLAQNLSSVGRRIPILNQGFKRVHAGFWQSYSSIREEYMRAVVAAIYAHRTQILHTLQSQSNVSPAHSMYVSSSSNTPTGSNRKHMHANNTNSAIKALFGSPLSKSNPFSPLFSPPQNNSYNGNTANNAQYSHTAHATAGATTTSTALDVVFCGHSLGAAIASLAAYELSENIKPILEALAMEALFNVPKSQALQTLPLLHALPAPVLSLYMYGSPRVGNSAFAGSLSRKVDNVYRIQVNGDVVTMLPKFVGFYRHAGTAVLLDDKERGNVIIQPSIIESSMLQYYTGSVHNHSLDKYRACLEACLEPAELTEYLAREFQNLHSSNVASNMDSVFGGKGDSSKTHKRQSINLSDIPEWMVSSGNV